MPGWKCCLGDKDGGARGLGVQVPAFAGDAANHCALRLFDVPSWPAAAFSGGRVSEADAVVLRNAVLSHVACPTGHWLGWAPVSGPIRQGLRP